MTWTWPHRGRPKVVPKYVQSCAILKMSIDFISDDIIFIVLYFIVYLWRLVFFV